MPSDLVELARFPSSAEACIARGQLECEGIRAELAGEAAASWLWHVGTAIGGVRLLVSREDADRAMDILASIAVIDETQKIDFGDDADKEHDDHESELPEDLVRAWRASLIGLFLLPPLLNIYSTWLLLRNGFFVARCRNWRIPAACSANLVVFTLVALFVFLIVNPPEAPLRPIDSTEETITIPLVPYR